MARSKAAVATIEPPTPATAAEVRQWATENGLTFSTRGRLSQQVKNEFTEVTGRPVAGTASME